MHPRRSRTQFDVTLSRWRSWKSLSHGEWRQRLPIT